MACFRDDEFLGRNHSIMDSRAPDPYYVNVAPPGPIPYTTMLSPPLPQRSGPRTLMIQGTTSDAGKTLLTAAFCRILVRQGVRVVPFKPQNMALNSAVTPEGGEIGRAQALQALAARLPPHTDMNPILLKPNSDIGAQVIINGQAIGHLDAVAYHNYKTEAMSHVLAAHQRLCQHYDTILVEGAGSPAEINLRDRDIANMGFAEAVDCPVVLVADIDRGGVFAHLVGTLELLSPTERRRVSGFIINKFRGDISLLTSGLAWLENKTGKPVFGVVPMIEGLQLPEEDGFFGHRFDHAPGPSVRPPPLKIAVPRFPRISNHTDLDPFRWHPEVELTLHGRAPDPLQADLVILPGSKSVRDDLAWFRAQGWQAALQRHLRYGGKVIGICGGFQMLGDALHDPLGVEGAPGSSPGLGFLEMETTFASKKELKENHGSLVFDNAPVSGYEIHMGHSLGPALARPAFRLREGDHGAISSDNLILGGYLHGLADQPQALAALLRWAGLESTQVIDLQQIHQTNLDRLADVVAASVDMDNLLSRSFS